MIGNEIFRQKKFEFTALAQCNITLKSFKKGCPQERQMKFDIDWAWIGDIKDKSFIRFISLYLCECFWKKKQQTNIEILMFLKAL